MDGERRRQTALAFLQAGREGRAHLELDRFATPEARHHNAYFPAGMETLTRAMAEAAEAQPQSTFEVQRVLADGDLVAVHGHFRPEPGHLGYATVHVFRFEGDRIAELWDLGQPVPEDCPNTDGMF